MKKTVALLLGLMLILGFALVACGDEATDDTADDATADAIDWTEAVDYETQTVTVTGEVVAVSDMYEEMGIGKMLVRLGGTEDEDHFNVVFVTDPDTGVWPENLADYQAIVNDDLIGKTVEATGVIVLNPFESCYEIRMNDADDNTAPDDEVTGVMVVK